ncbi:MAG: type II toxin-antitoxin system VapC family toxin [Candidatus Bathyarchaeia archaeon]|nr:type II toxin-antitoxin system VapC family toxin [Candidatus Bathyarchaeota archaeon]
MVVIDASVLLQIPFEEEFTEQARSLVRDVDSIEAPNLLWYEVGNGLIRLYRRKLIDRQEAEESLRRLMQIPVRLIEADKIQTLRSALDLQITFYDAAYIDVASKLGTEFYTADNLLYERASKRVKTIHLGII